MPADTTSPSNTVPLHCIYWGPILVRIISAPTPEDAQQQADDLWRKWTAQN